MKKPKPPPKLFLRIARGTQNPTFDEVPAPEPFDRSLLDTLTSLHDQHDGPRPFPAFSGGSVRNSSDGNTSDDNTTDGSSARNTSDDNTSDKCADGKCGRCAVLVDGTAKLACRTTLQSLIGKKRKKTVTLRPLSKFPISADLSVERPPQISRTGLPTALGSCIDCGICFEVCPNTGADKAFIGPLRLAAAASNYDNAAESRALALSESGLAACHGAKNCTAYCPQGIDLAAEIRDLNGHARRELWRHIFGYRTGNAASAQSVDTPTPDPGSPKSAAGD